MQAETSTPPENREALQKVLASETFRRADTLRRLLAYLGDAALNSTAESLKEYTIGVEALGKPSNYDPQTDSTVRVLAGKLRLKLDEYSRTEGAQERFRLHLPKGHFRLVFEAKQAEAEAPPPSRVRVWQGVSLTLAIAVAGLAVVALQRSSVPASPDDGWTPELEALWAPMIHSNAPIMLSFETGLFFTVGGWTLRRPEINSPSELQSSAEVRRLLEHLPGTLRLEHTYVGFGGVNGVFLLANRLRSRKPQLTLKRSVALAWEDIRDNHIVFIGVGKTSSKIRDLISKGDFSWADGSVTNLRPRPGEAREYVQRSLPSGERAEHYGVISMLPGFEEGKRVFILGGGSAEGEWAAAEYVTDPRHVRELASRMRDSAGRFPDAFQVVIRMKFSSQVPIDVSYVTHHTLEHLN